MIGNSQILLPAYDNTYYSDEDVRRSWYAGDDFFAMPQRQYCSIRDFGILDYATVLYKDDSDDNRYVTVFGETQ